MYQRRSPTEKQRASTDASSGSIPHRSTRTLWNWNERRALYRRAIFWVGRARLACPSSEAPASRRPLRWGLRTRPSHSWALSAPPATAWRGCSHPAPRPRRRRRGWTGAAGGLWGGLGGPFPAAPTTWRRRRREQISERVSSDDSGTPEQWKEESFDLFFVVFGSRLVRHVSFPTTASGPFT